MEKDERHIWNGSENIENAFWVLFATANESSISESDIQKIYSDFSFRIFFFVPSHVSHNGVRKFNHWQFLTMYIESAMYVFSSTAQGCHTPFTVHPSIPR